MKLIAYDELTVTPWKNGGGVTRELACWPPDATVNDFVWRVSIADVGQSGPFSIFPGIDRIITLLEGDGMRLQFAQGHAHALTDTLAPYRFRGEDSLDAHLIGSPSRDFNLMLRRDAAYGAVEVWSTGGAIPNAIPDAVARVADPVQTTLLLFCASGHWQVTAVDGISHALTQDNGLLLENPTGDTTIAPLRAGSALLCVRICVRMQVARRNE